VRVGAMETAAEEPERAAPSPGTPAGTPLGTGGTAVPPQPPKRSLYAVPNPGDDALTAPRKLVQADVESRCMELRIRGKAYAAIAAEVGVTEETAIDAVERVLQRTRRGTDAKADLARALEVQRIDRLVEAVWERATDPTRAVAMGETLNAVEVGGYDPSQDKAIERLTKLLERRSKLLGLDTPTTGPLVQVNVLNVPGVRDLLVLVMGAVEPFPEAKAAVVGALRAKVGGAGALAPPREVLALPEGGS
jgi:hypothetical protein